MALLMNSYVVVLISAAFLVVSSVADDLLLCKPANDLFKDSYGHRQNGTTHTGHGHSGHTRHHGLKGESGQGIYEAVTEIVEGMALKGLTSVVTAVEELREDVANLRQTLREQLDCQAPNFQYNGTCYIIPHLSSSSYLNRADAVRNCQDLGAEMAQIYDRTQEIVLMEAFLRNRKARTEESAAVWIGMTYNAGTNMVQYRSGLEIQGTEFNWWSGYPINGRYLALGVTEHVGGRDGFYVAPETTGLKGVLCEKSLE